MARTLADGDIVQATIVTQMGDQVALNVLHYLCGIDSGTSADDTDFARQFSAAIEANWKSALNNTATFKGVMVQVINPPPITRRIADVADAGVGTGGATPQPPQVSGIIRWATNTAGRTGRGRIYVPFPSTTFIDTDGTPTAAYVAALAGIATDLGTFIVVSRGGGGGAIAGSAEWQHG